jgi:lipoprotein-anchoring transpeptidase ErfK/SrfK
MQLVSVLVPVVALAVLSAPASASVRAQRLFVLEQRVLVRAAPAPDAHPLAAVSEVTPLTSSQTVLPVVGRRLGPAGGWWVKVLLPGRPNRSTGWVPLAEGHEDETGWRIVVDRSDRRGTVFQDGRRRASFPVVVGAPATPSPLGTFFVIEKLHLGLTVQQGPWALATSAYSDVLGEFAGGPGQIALHGRVGLADPLGSATSHGCIRFSNAAITWLATHVTAGTPVIVRR